MRAAWVALFCWVAPTVAVGLAYAISAWGGQVPWCVPFVDGCTSISGAARRDPSIHLFRALMLPTASVLAGYWLLVYAWLGLLGGGRRGRAWILALGLTGAFFLVAYVVFLGTDAWVYELMRRYGVTVYFSFTALAQLVLAARLRRLPPEMRWLAGSGVIGAKAGFGFAMLALGLINVVAKNIYVHAPVDNIVAWNFALLMHGYFGLTALSWWKSGYRINATVGSSD